MKIAILNTGNINDRKGAFNNVQERIKHLQAVNGVELDVYLIRYYDSWTFRLLRNKKENIKERITIVDGIQYNNLWVKLKLWNYLLTYTLRLTGLLGKSQLNNFVDLFKGYDLLSVHTLPDMHLAHLVKLKHGIPFVTTWHGSDINVWPFRNKSGFKITKTILENADYNFFVSKHLMNASEKIFTTKSKDYLYTGPSDIFFRKDPKEKNEIRKNINIQTKYLIGFIGNIVPIKNVLVLPDIFSIINRRMADVSFIIVGDGELLKELRVQMAKRNITNIVYTGKIDPEKIPDIMSCLDILLLPSLNEGMPRVSLEAQACGVHVVGSDRGGIPESIGKENSFSLDNNFIENISNRIIDILNNEKSYPSLPEKFLWDKAVAKEIKVYNECIKK